MNSGRDRRRHKRVKVNIPALLYLGEKDGTPCRILNISEGGALVHCSDPVAAIGETLKLELKYREAPIQFVGKIAKRDQVEIELIEDEPEKSVIRWTKGSSGAFGVEFVNVPPERLIFLKRLIHYFADKYGWDEDAPK